MKRNLLIALLVIALAAALTACNLPSGTPRASTPTSIIEPGNTEPTTAPEGTATATLPPIITATSDAEVGGGTEATATATKAAAGSVTATPTVNVTQSASCTYRVTYVSDVTIPDDTVVAAGASFVKTWRVRNDGTCTWGPSGYPLHALAYSSGNKLGAADQVALPSVVKPGDTVDLSVNMVAPSTNGTYTSGWKFRIDGDPAGRGPLIGLGANQTSELFARIRVGAASATSTPVVSGNRTRLSFASGATSTSITGSLTAGSKRGYVLSAGYGQILNAKLTTPDGATLDIAAGNGASLSVSKSSDNTSAYTKLPSTQDYIVWVTAGSDTADYTLEVTIPATISFASGTSSRSVNGASTGSRTNSYAVAASSGQTLNVTLTGSNVVLNIYGLQGGQSLLSNSSGATTYSGTLPASQDYIIQVVPSTASANYTLKVEVK